jgi:hypothetical protein
MGPFTEPAYTTIRRWKRAAKLPLPSQPPHDDSFSVSPDSRGARMSAGAVVTLAASLSSFCCTSWSLPFGRGCRSVG